MRCGICRSTSPGSRPGPAGLASDRIPGPSPPLTVGLHGQLLPGPLGPSPGGAALLTPVLRGGRRWGCPDNRGRAGRGPADGEREGPKSDVERGAAHGREWRRGSGLGTSAAPTEPRPELGKPLSASVGTTRASAELGKLPPWLRSASVAAAAAWFIESHVTDQER